MRIVGPCLCSEERFRVNIERGYASKRYLANAVSALRITFLFTIAGCATSCRHCHSEGGRGPGISIKDYADGLEKLAPVISTLESDNSVDIDWNYEPLAHLEFHKLLRLTAERFPNQESAGEYWPTSGAPLVLNPNRDLILQELKKNGVKKIDFTITGAPERHNRNVRNSRAFEFFSNAVREIQRRAG